MRRDLPSFLSLDKTDLVSWQDARTVILPLPFERTVVWGKGTSRGPEALLEASAFIELYDEELDCEPCRHGIHTAPAFLPQSEDLGECMDQMEAEARRHLDAGKFLISLGGEHSMTLAPVRATQKAVRELHGTDLGIVQFDAHTDLRDSYHGTPYSHASVMRRVLELGVPSLPVGIRSSAPEEMPVIREHDIPVIWSHDVHRDTRTGSTQRFLDALERLPDKIYLTFDIDFFDPSVVPSTGTPEPGGGFWHPTIEWLRLLFESKDVVAMDVVELAPVDGHPASDFVAAKLVHKCIGYKFDLA
ncbi:MAG: agmatinase [Thermoanaerobaculia bacterium]|nr:agmatinase [Thermoanaerobaculia bacterium]